MNPYNWWSPDFQHEYFVQHVYMRGDTAGYGIYDERMRRVDTVRKYQDGFKTAEEAQAALDEMAKERGWIKP